MVKDIFNLYYYIDETVKGNMSAIFGFKYINTTTKTSPTPPTLSKFYTQVPSIIAGDINNIISIIPIQSCPFLSICNAYYNVCIIWKINWRFHISANPYAAQMLWFHHHIYIFQWLLLPKQVVLYNDNNKHINHWPYPVVLWKLYYFNRELFKVVWLA